MRIESRGAEALIDLVEAAFDLAVDDTLELARAHAAKHSRTGGFAASLTRTPTVRDGDRLEARIGSPLSSARVKETGAFIQSQTGGMMRFRLDTGAWVTLEAFRVPAQPAVAPAGGRFAAIMTARLRALGLAGIGHARRFASSPDFRGGAVSIHSPEFRRSHGIR